MLCLQMAVSRQQAAEQDCRARTAGGGRPELGEMGRRMSQGRSLCQPPGARTTCLPTGNGGFTCNSPTAPTRDGARLTPGRRLRLRASDTVPRPADGWRAPAGAAKAHARRPAAARQGLEGSDTGRGQLRGPGRPRGQERAFYTAFSGAGSDPTLSRTEGPIGAWRDLGSAGNGVLALSVAGRR